jgi:UDPglucose 6-dehydrogenase
MIQKIAVFGVGAVGQAIYKTLSAGYQIEVVGYDPAKSEYSENFSIAAVCPIWFICVPTPSSGDSLKTELVEDLVVAAAAYAHKPLLVIKSTLPLGTMKELEKLYDRVVYVPEFLIERRPDASLVDRIVIGSAAEELVDEVVGLLLRVPGWAKAPFLAMRSEEAELVKLASNGFLAVKVAMANDIADLCERRGLKYDRVREGISADSRIGLSHMTVPGPDGKKGFGGTCFPKDLEALASLFDGDFWHSPFAAASLQNRSRRPECYAHSDSAQPSLLVAEA